MTNQMIILGERIRLMQEGKLSGSGLFTEVESNGELKRLEIPEQIHTYNGWKARGYQVRKGEKSDIKFPIWKSVKRKSKDGEESGEKMILKVSAFFTMAQVEPIK